MEIADVFTYAIWFTSLMIVQGAIVIFLVWLLRKRQVWSLIMFALRGGSLILKGHIDNTIEILHTTKAIDAVRWKTREPVTKKKIDMMQPIKRVFHTLKGTSNPIHICPYSYPTNISIMTKEKAQLNTKEINALMVKQYTQGAADATSFNRIGGFPLDKATLLTLFIVGIMVVILIAINLQIMGAVSPA